MEFLIPLTITLIVGVAAVLLVIGLFSAPWPILLLLLMLGLINTRRIIQSNLVQSVPQSVETSSQTKSVSVPESTKDKVLVYRGAIYEQPSLMAEDATKVSQIEISGKYRGSAWKSTQKLFVKEN